MPMALLLCSSRTPSSLKSVTVLEELEKNQSAADVADVSPDSENAPVLGVTVGLELFAQQLNPPADLKIGVRPFHRHK